jgi:predicted naringenin-chalcone synthase
MFTGQEAFVVGYGLTVPKGVSTDEIVRQMLTVRKLHGQSEETLKKVEFIHKQTGITCRHFCHTFLERELCVTDSQEVMNKKLSFIHTTDVGNVKEGIYLKSNNYNPPLWLRMKCFQETAVMLAIDAAEKALLNWGGDRSTITHIITTCTSGWQEPGIAAAIIKAAKLSEDCQKAELNFNGCFCGATCLRLGRDIIRSGNSAALIVACEIASTHADFTDEAAQSIVAQSLFADGAAAIVLSSTPKKGAWKFTQTGCSVVPNSSHLLGLYPPIEEKQNTYKMVLDPQVAATLGDYFRVGHGKDLLLKMCPDILKNKPKKLVTEEGSAVDDKNADDDDNNNSDNKPALCVHPGGPRILDAIRSVLTDLGWNKNALDSSYESFHSFGNLGAAAMLFVLARRLSLDDIEKDDLVMMAFGPGVTVEWSTLKRVL